jgi:hypothetical protein
MPTYNLAKFRSEIQPPNFFAPLTEADILFMDGFQFILQNHQRQGGISILFFYFKEIQQK